MTRTMAERLALFVSGGVVTILTVIVGVPTWLVAPTVMAVAAGLVEAQAARRTGRRHWLMAWLPATLGILAPIGVVAIVERPPAADAGLALSILLSGLAVAVPLFAAAVLAIAYVAEKAGSRGMEA